MKYTVKVIPRSSKNQVIEIGNHELKIKLTAPPVGGRANELLIEVLADHFGVKKSAVRIVSGVAGRKKIVEINI